MRLESEAIALRYKPIDLANENFHGKYPIVIHTTQGLDEVTLQHGKSYRHDLVPYKLSEFSSINRIENRSQTNRVSKYNLTNIIFILDRSFSMDETLHDTELFTGYPQTKLDYIKSAIRGLQNSIPEESNIHLIEFNHSSKAFNLEQNKDNSAAELLIEEIDTIQPGGMTNFTEALQDAREIIENFGSSANERNLIIFITDGVDIDTSRGTASQLALDLSATNTATFIAGIGADYDLSNIVDLSSDFGYSGWNHLPDPNMSVHALRIILEDVIKEIQTNDFYLKLRLKGDFSDLVTSDPARRFGRYNSVNIGYQKESLSFCLQGKNDIEIDLIGGTSASEKNPQKLTIPIIDIDDSGINYKLAQKIWFDEVGPTLLFLAQLKYQTEDSTLEEIAREFPNLRNNIENFIDQRSKKENVVERNHLNATFSEASGILRTIANQAIIETFTKPLGTTVFGNT